MPPSRGILISFPGYPSSLSGFFYDNGLGNLLSSLQTAGHEAIALDFTTPDLLAWFFPHNFKNAIKEKVAEIKSLQIQNLPMPKTLIAQFREIDASINAFQTEQLSEFVRKEIFSKIMLFKPDFIGFKLWIGEGFTSSIKIAAMIRKEFPAIKIYGGGPQVDWFGQYIYTLNFGESFDAIAYGEGEETICLLAAHAKNEMPLSGIPNIFYMEHDKIVKTVEKRISCLDTLPDPVYSSEAYFPSGKNKKIKVLVLDESRGCPNRCSFCMHPHKSGGEWRARNAAHVVDLMERMIAKYRTNIFRFAGSNPPPDLKIAVAKEIIRRGLKVKYAAFGHARGMCLDDYKLLKESGCVSLFFGVESGSQRILNTAMNKKVSVEQIRQALLMCKAAGIRTVASVIVPSPFDDEESINDTYALLKSTKPDYAVVNVPGALPNTKWFTDNSHYGFEFGDKEVFVKNFMGYSIKNFYPPELWQDTPQYMLGNLTFQDIIKKNAAFTQSLQALGIATRVTDDMALLIESTGMPADELVNTSWSFLAGGDQIGLENFIETVNKKIYKNL